MVYSNYRTLDSSLTVGFYTDDNHRFYKRWYNVHMGQAADKEYTCSAGLNTEQCRDQIGSGLGSDCTITKNLNTIKYARSGTQITNNGDSFGGNYGDSGKPEYLHCVYKMKNYRRTLDYCDAGIDSFDRNRGSTWEGQDFIMASGNPHSTCILRKDEDDATGLGTVLACSGSNLFGQAGQKPEPVTFSVNGGPEQTLDYTKVSYRDYEQAWIYSFPFPGYEGWGLHLFDGDNDAIESEEILNEILSYLGHWNLGLPWAYLSCGEISTNNPKQVDSANESSCNGVHGNELRNSVYENSVEIPVNDSRIKVLDTSL